MIVIAVCSSFLLELDNVILLYVAFYTVMTGSQPLKIATPAEASAKLIKPLIVCSINLHDCMIMPCSVDTSAKCNKRITWFAECHYHPALCGMIHV